MVQTKTAPENWLRGLRERERSGEWKRRGGERESLRCGVDLELVRTSSGLGVVCRILALAGVDGFVHLRQRVITYLSGPDFARVPLLNNKYVIYSVR